jgi:hypothetical protein
MTSFQARLTASQIDVTYPCSSPSGVLGDAVDGGGGVAVGEQQLRG